MSERESFGSLFPLFKANIQNCILCDGSSCQRAQAIERRLSILGRIEYCYITRSLLVKSTEPSRGLDTRSPTELRGGGDLTDPGRQRHTGVQRHHPQRSTDSGGAGGRWALCDCTCALFCLQLVFLRINIQHYFFNTLRKLHGLP